MSNSKTIGIISINLSLILLFTVNFGNFFNWFKFERIFNFFLIFLIVERIIETYLIRTDWILKEVPSDKLLGQVVYSYLTVLIVSVCENIIEDRSFSTYTLVAGFLYFVSLCIRFYSIYFLGKNWNISTNDTNNLQIIKLGPYANIRHPYYIGAILELTSITIFFGSIFGLILCLTLFCPFEILRAKAEENILIQKTGWKYIKYKKEVGMFFPKLRNIAYYDRRILKKSYQHPERRLIERRRNDIEVAFDRRFYVQKS